MEKVTQTFNSAAAFQENALDVTQTLDVSTPEVAQP